MTPAVTIEHCGRTIAASVVAFDIRWSGELPADSEVTWAVRVTSGDADENVELGHRRCGERLSQYARDLSTGRTQEVSPDADLDPGPDAGEITVRFPADVVGLAVEWPTWQAVIEVAGEDVSALAVTL
jgi:hypothetical protein